MAIREETMAALQSTFTISPWLLTAPLLVIGLIAFRIPAIPAILVGALIGGAYIPLFQHHLLLQMAGVDQVTWQVAAKGIMQALTVSVTLPMENELLSELLVSRGMAGMLNTVWLIISAMVFGGILERAGHLQRISTALLSFAKNTFSLVATTVGTCLAVNITASDQYLAIVVPGRMYADAYKKANLAPENLSRTLEDSGTVTSALVPWNSCGAYQSGVLGVATGDYFAYAIFNWVSPLMTLLFAGLGIKIRKIKA